MGPRLYAIVVEGELGPAVCTAAFDGMTPTRAEGSTTFVGLIRDQAELMGLLQRVSDLGLTLLCARVTSSE